MPVGDSYKAAMAEKSNRGDLPADAEAEHLETVAGEEEKLGKRQKLKRHLARFWCCYLLAGIIFLAIFLPVFFLVAIPAIAQRIVDDTDLPVYAAHIMDPKPDAVTFTLDTSLTIPLGLSVKIDPLDLNLFNRESDPQVDYLVVGIPEYSLKGTTEISVTSTNTPVLDSAEFIKALTKAVYSKRFTLSAKGSTTGHLGALKAPLTLDKDVELDGLDKLSGFSIDKAALLLPAEADGTNLRGKATLPNHSVVTFALGNVTLNLKSGDLVLGTALIQNVVLSPGNNSVDMAGKIDLNNAIANIGPLLQAQQDALKNGEIELSASGNQSVYHGEHIPYFEEVLNGLTITARVPIVQLLLDTLENFLGDGSQGLIETISKLLDKLDLGKIFQNIDFNDLFDSLGGILNDLDLGKLLDGIDLTGLLNSIDWDKLVDGLVSILNQLDLPALLQDLDIGKLLSGIDWTSLFASLGKVLQNIDWASLMDTLTTILQKVDLSKIFNALAPLLENLDLGKILSSIDLGSIINGLASALGGVDWGAILKNIDLPAIIDKLGPLLKQLDIGAILKNIDLPAIITSLGNALKNVDLGELLKNLDIPSLISSLGSLISNLDLGDILKNLDLGGLLQSLFGALKNLDLGGLLDGLDIGGVNVGGLLQGLADQGNGESLSDALGNLQDALDNVGGGGG